VPDLGVDPVPFEAVLSLLVGQHLLSVQDRVAAILGAAHGDHQSLYRFPSGVEDETGEVVRLLPVGSAFAAANNAPCSATSDRDAGARSVAPPRVFLRSESREEKEEGVHVRKGSDID